MINVLGTNMPVELIIFFSALAPNIHDQLTSLRDVLSWKLRIVVFCVHVHHYSFAKSSVADGAIDDEFVNTWHEVSCVDKHVFVFGGIGEIFEVLRSCIFNVDVSELVIEALIVENVLPIANLFKN
tara:strand:- start:257 stop:634 length:378 start_codon:yes stop_codon:yes gene_type:complete